MVMNDEHNDSNGPIWDSPDELSILGWPWSLSSPTSMKQATSGPMLPWSDATFVRTSWSRMGRIGCVTVWPTGVSGVSLSYPRFLLTGVLGLFATLKLLYSNRVGCGLSCEGRPSTKWREQTLWYRFSFSKLNWSCPPPLRSKLYQMRRSATDPGSLWNVTPFIQGYLSNNLNFRESDVQPTATQCRFGIVIFSTPLCIIYWLSTDSKLLTHKGVQYYC